MSLSLGVGRTYITRDGSSVTIVHQNGDHQYPFFGVIGGDGGRLAFFSTNGSYKNNGQSDFDIVAEASASEHSYVPD